MKLANALAFGQEQLQQSYSPALDAQLLLAYSLSVEQAYLAANSEQLLTTAQQSIYFGYVARAQNLEPIPYITGEIAFRYLELAISPAALIPRSETEQLIDIVKHWVAGRSGLHLVDVGTGSGCIAISLATEIEDCVIEAVEISAETLTLAQTNAQTYAAPITFYHGSLLEPLPHAVDAIVANLPYITDAEWTALDDAVKLYEPATALRGGTAGLDLVEQLLQQAADKLCSAGAIFLEIGWKQGADTVALAQSIFPQATIQLLPDYAQNDRFVVIET